MSSRDMTLTEIKHTTKSFDDTHTIKVSGFKDGGGRITTTEVLKTTAKMINDLSIETRSAVNDIAKQILSVRDELLVAINNLDKKLTTRIDNLVSKNNLKE